MRTLATFLAVLLALMAQAWANGGGAGSGGGTGGLVGGPLQFDAVGILSTGTFTIGGETTGVTLKTDHGTYELSLFGEMARQAEALNGKRVHVVGTLTEVPGIETRGRRIVAVSSILAVNPPNLMPIYPMSVNY